MQDTGANDPSTIRESNEPDRIVTRESSTDKPNLSQIAPGLRHLAVPVAQLSLMVGNPRLHPAKNL